MTGHHDPARRGTRGYLSTLARRTLSLLGLGEAHGANAASARRGPKRAADLGGRQGGPDRGARPLLHRALDLDEIMLDEVMVHRKSIDMLNCDEKPSTLISQALKAGHTRFPLYRDEPDNIVGVLHVKDLLRALWENEGNADGIVVADIARAPYFAPDTTSLQEQLDNFRKKQEHFAIVVDEYGAIKGLVTIEDIIEEIVGEIEDEHDSPVQGVRPQADNSVNVDGHVTIRDLNRIMDWALPDADAVTVAGLVIHESRSIPEVGQTFSFHGFRFRILRRRRNQVTALKVTPIESGAAAVPDAAGEA